VAAVYLVAQSGKITTVIGPNGAGKTTLLNIISGFQPPNSGKVSVGGRETTGMTAFDVVRSGVARTFQTAQPFGNLSILDNVRVGLLHGSGRGEASPDRARSMVALVR